MTSVLYVVPVEHAHEAEEWPDAAKFYVHAKGVFGRILCETDGSIGRDTVFNPLTAMTILAEISFSGDDTTLKQGNEDGIQKVRTWAKEGKDMFATWVH